MKILDPEEEEEYALFMDKIATAIYLESYKHIKELHERHVDPLINTEEIGMATGQVVLDKVIEMTKDMPKEKLLRIFTEVAISHSVNTMQRHPEYKMRIAFLNGLI